MVKVLPEIQETTEINLPRSGAPNWAIGIGGTVWQLSIILLLSQVCFWLMANHIGQDELEKTTANMAVVGAALYAILKNKSE